MKSKRHISIDDTAAIIEVMQEAVAEAIEVHRRMKQPIVGMRDNRVVWIKPADITPRALPGDDEPVPDDIEL